MHRDSRASLCASPGRLGVETLRGRPEQGRNGLSHNPTLGPRRPFRGRCAPGWRIAKLGGLLGVTDDERRIVVGGGSQGTAFDVTL
jgi:hypothetical protein